MIPLDSLREAAPDVIRYPHFRTIDHPSGLAVCQRIFDHPFGGWQIATVIPRRGKR